MLPEHYCDFLLALYEQGEEVKKPTKKHRPVLKQQSSKLIIWQLLLSIVTGAVLSLIFFSSTIWVPLMAGIAMSILLGAITYMLAQRSKKAPVLPVLLALTLLALSLKVWLLHFSEQPSVLFVTVLVHCVLWIIAGKVWKQIYFLISGIAGILIILYFLLF